MPCVVFTAKVWTKVKDLTSEAVGKRVLVRARLHTTRGTGIFLILIWFKYSSVICLVSGTVLNFIAIHISFVIGKQCFMILRDRQYTVQGVCAVNDVISKAMVKFAAG